ncbi:uncharacterized protein PHALS_09473 [Plasmopara halstedii]|uniref:Uncharacterized protein n=1 Tax=Plasmopara halstedii TaxID=4781 RepID=A0A0N7L3A7_PLAHL|nr:uncharacterized protein PHALS_09473 [Plasmopara halstedii]CEG35347.1 hypothetical protein PHALS_09473 [Plasmopara halstedii]|eukprot:XP_024571716.1 hypothetical protein PHALS_09473 [Plasmopara halstedii]
MDSITSKYTFLHGEYLSKGIYSSIARECLIVIYLAAPPEAKFCWRRIQQALGNGQ